MNGYWTFKVVIIWGGREYLTVSLIKNTATVLKGKWKSMIIYKNRLYSCNYKIYWLFCHFQDEKTLHTSCIILLHRTAFRQSLLKLCKHTVPHLLLYPQDGGVAAWVYWHQGLWGPEKQLWSFGGRGEGFLGLWGGNCKCLGTESGL